MSTHPGCDNGTHGVEVPVPSCGHPQATAGNPCPVCGSRPVVAIAMAYNEHPLDHALRQRAHLEQQIGAQQVSRRAR